MKPFVGYTLAAVALALAMSSARAEPPKRVVSFNLCADQLVVALADREQIAGLSPYAADPRLSVVAEQARNYPRLNWQAEATIALAPDLVILGTSDRPVTRRLLTRHGIRVAAIDLVTDIAAARKQIRDVAELLGHPERGDALLARLDAAQARLAAVPHTAFSTALVIERGGYTQGPASLVGALLTQAGLRPPAGAPAGYGTYVPLETLVALHPDLLFVKDPPAQARDQGALFVTHPALQTLYPPTRRIALPTRYTLCGGPALVEAFDYLADVMQRLAASP
jgi:iron complex transport system substrate-binding protein